MPEMSGSAPAASTKVVPSDNAAAAAAPAITGRNPIITRLPTSEIRLRCCRNRVKLSGRHIDIVLCTDDFLERGRRAPVMHHRRPWHVECLRVVDSEID